ncbi:MAG TPA: DUF4337 domain-containing protein [Anaeromyxobacteraceae bacterium]
MAEAAKQHAQPAPEPAKPAAPPRERWMQWVALTTTVLAVCAAISALKGGGYSTKVQLSTTQEANRWSHFQAKSIKQHAVELHRDDLELAQLEARTPEAQRLAGERIARAKAEIARYDQEKGAIKLEADAIQKEEGELKQHGQAFGLAVMLLQIAIMLSSVGALMKRPAMWVVGLVFGSGGLFYMANGFWLFF